MAPDVLSLDNVYLNLSKSPGQLRIASSGVAYRLLSTKETTTVPASDIKKVQWSRSSRHFEIKLTTSHGSVQLDGLRETELDAIKDSFQDMGFVVDVKEYSVKGWNWGKAQVEGGELKFT